MAPVSQISAICDERKNGGEEDDLKGPFGGGPLFAPYGRDILNTGGGGNSSVISSGYGVFSKFCETILSLTFV